MSLFRIAVFSRYGYFISITDDPCPKIRTLHVAVVCCLSVLVSKGNRKMEQPGEPEGKQGENTKKNWWEWMALRDLDRALIYKFYKGDLASLQLPIWHLNPLPHWMYWDAPHPNTAYPFLLLHFPLFLITNKKQENTWKI